MGKIERIFVYAGLAVFVVVMIYVFTTSRAELSKYKERYEALEKAHQGLISEVKQKEKGWDKQRTDLAGKTRVLSGKLKDLQASYNNVVKKNQELEVKTKELETKYAGLEKKLAEVKIPETVPEQIREFKELGYRAVHLAKSEPAPHEGIEFDLPSAEELLRVAITFPIIKEQKEICLAGVSNMKERNANLESGVSNLQKQLEFQDEITVIERAKTDLEKSRGDFYAEQGVQKDKLLDQCKDLNQDLYKEAKRKTWWKTLAIGQTILFIGLVIFLAL